MLHLAISVMLIWVAFNIAFVVLRLRATRSPHGAKNLNGCMTPYHPEIVPLHRQMQR
ncbi:hypothetical protein [Bradyrhizobium guangzhouense]|uniref:hypothetical protein n=1 Tax=Bradyrhizobium guangzhouense TaxID=1325095 RepID=UPI0013E8D677|nr:hypothetical protein [Bradyrhizobium guangzhouense]